MRRNKQNSNAEMGVHIGSASIVMIFAVLCLAIFATLSFETASHEYRLAHKTADAAKAYYAADCAAEEVYAQVCALIAKEKNSDRIKTELEALHVHMDQTGQQAVLQYSIPVDDTQALNVVLLWEENAVSVMKWQIIATSRWEYDENLHVWNGSVDEAE